MQKIFTAVSLLIIASPSFAAIGGANNVPEPETLALVGLGAAAFLATRLIKK